MNIHFGLHFSSDAYIDIEKRGGIMFDECIANIDELVKLLPIMLLSVRLLTRRHLQSLGKPIVLA